MVNFFGTRTSKKAETLYIGGEPMKTTMITIGLIIGVLVFLGVTTSWADGRIYHHHPKKVANTAKLSKIDNYHHRRIPHYSDRDKRHYYAKRPKHIVRRHHIKHRHHLSSRPSPRYHHRYHRRYHYSYPLGFRFLGRIY